MWLFPGKSEGKPSLTAALKWNWEKAESASICKREVFAFSLCLNKYLESLVCSASLLMPILRLYWGPFFALAQCHVGEQISSTIPAKRSKGAKWIKENCGISVVAIW